MTRGTEAAIAVAREQSQNGPQYGVGECLMRVRGCYAVAAKYPDAATAWRNTKKPHPVPADANIPRGVPIWWTGGSKGFGHVAIATGDGQCWSTDIRRPGMFDKVPISEIHAEWGMPFEGWSEDINDVTVYIPPAPKQPPSSLRGVGFNMAQATTAKPVRRLIQRLLARWGRRPDVICLQEARFAHKALRGMDVYRFVGGGHPVDDEVRAELVTLVHRKRGHVISTAYTEAAQGEGKTGPKSHDRGIQVTIVESRGWRFAVVNTHMGFTPIQVTDHIRTIRAVLDGLATQGLPVLLAADANSAATELERLLLKRKFRVNRHGVDIIATTFPMRGGRVSKAWTGSDHDAVTARRKRT